MIPHTFEFLTLKIMYVQTEDAASSSSKISEENVRKRVRPLCRSDASDSSVSMGR